jgi:hypothetical protein
MLPGKGSEYDGTKFSSSHSDVAATLPAEKRTGTLFIKNINGTGDIRQAKAGTSQDTPASACLDFRSTILPFAKRAFVD